MIITKSKRAIAFTLAVFMCFSLLLSMNPAVSYAAGQENIYKTQAPGADYSGYIFTAEKVSDTLMKLHVSIQNLSRTYFYDYKLKFDETKLQYARPNGSVETGASPRYEAAGYTESMGVTAGYVGTLNNDEYDGFLETKTTGVSNEKGNSTYLYTTWDSAFVNIAYGLRATGLDPTVKNMLGINEDGYEPPAGVAVPLLTMYFTTVNGNTLADITAADLQVYTEDPSGYPGGIGQINSDGTKVGLNAYFDCTEVPSLAEGAGGETPAEPKNVTFTVQVTNDTGAQVPVSGAAITIYNGSETVGRYTTDSSGQVTVNLNQGTYTYTISLDGYVEKSDTVTVGSTDLSVPAVTLSPIPDVADAHYYLKGAYSPGTNEYKMQVYLKNILADAGSFGLNYDKRILTLKKADIKVPQANRPALENNTEKGYHTFSYGSAFDIGGTFTDGIDGRVDGGALIAEYTFTLSQDHYEKKLNADSFQVMNWNETTRSTEVDASVNADVFRKDENAPGGGYYLGYQYMSDESEGQQQSIELPFIFDFTHNDRYTLYVNTKVKGGSAPVPNAAVTVTSGGTALNGTTDANGKSEIVISDGTYEFGIEADGYFPYPDPDNTEDVSEVVISGASVTVDADMQPMTIYEVRWDLTGGTINETVSSTAEAISLADYVFSVKADPGYSFTKEDITATYGGVTAAAVNYDPATNKYVIDGSEVLGDLTIDVAFKSRDYTVAASVGTGGALYVNNSETPSPYTETKTAGSSSSPFRFDADEGYVIRTVLLDGASVSDAVGTTSYAMQLDNITNDSSIAVTFGVENTSGGGIDPLEYSLYINAGHHGNISLTQPEAMTVTGGAAKTMVMPTGAAYHLTIEADSDYVIDKLIKNGAVIEDASGKTSYGPISESITTDTAFYATFRYTSGASIQYVVTAEAKIGGTSTPLGARTYDAGDTPTYFFNPVDTTWTLDGVELKNIDAQSSTAVTPASTGPAYSYTFDPIEANFHLTVAYKEKTKPVLINVSTIAKDPSKAFKATVIFTRSDGAVFKDENVGTSTTIDIPKGIYTIHVERKGYLDYDITGFEMTEAMLNDTNSNYYEIPKTVVLIPGDANWDGDAVTFRDVAVVAGGFGGRLVTNADLNNDGTVTATEDLAHVNNNYGKLKTDIAWNDFIVQL